MNPAGNLSYDVFVNDPPKQDGVLPNGEPKRFSPMASTLIYGRQDAVLTDPGMTEDQARVLGDSVAARGRNLGRLILWVSARALYGVREHPGENAAQIILASWL